MKVVDLFCGCGGISLGFSMGGHDVIYGLDNNKDAVETFQRNFPNATTICKKIEDLHHEEIPEADIIVGGPPCVNFSSSKGSRANVLEGLKLVQQFLRFVYLRKPKYWIMENVPRIGLHLPGEIPLRWIGIDQEGFLEVPQKKLFETYKYGVPQKRSRLLIGNYPIPKISYQDFDGNPSNLSRINTLGDILSSFPIPESNLAMIIKDPIYGIKLQSSELTDHYYDSIMSEIESLKIENAKTNHPYMGRMNFPDDLDKPSRTVVSLQMGRETIVVQTPNKKYRRLTVRECATIQTFPITFKFGGATWESRYRQAGNAVPPLLTYLISQEINKENGLIVKPPQIDSPKPFPEANSRKRKIIREIDYSKSKSILFPGKELRGFRIELKSEYVNNNAFWNSIFHSGEGKANHISFDLDEKPLYDFVVKNLDLMDKKLLILFKSLIQEIETLDPESGIVCHKYYHDSYGLTHPQYIEKIINLINKYFPQESYLKIDVPIIYNILPVKRKNIRLRLFISLYISKIIVNKLNAYKNNLIAV